MQNNAQKKDEKGINIRICKIQNNQKNQPKKIVDKTSLVELDWLVSLGLKTSQNLAERNPGRSLPWRCWKAQLELWSKSRDQWVEWIPSGELTFCYGKSPCLIGKSTISMAIFNSYVK